MKIKTLFLLFLLLPSLLMAESLVVDSEFQHNNTWQHQEADLNRTTTITLPSGAFRRTDDGKLQLNTGGYDNDQSDDNDWKKPRPFLMDEGIQVLQEAEDWLKQSLENIASLLEQPMSRQEIEAQQQRLSDLEKELEAFRRQEEMAEVVNIVGGQSEEEEIAFRNHPGFQEVHPAHSGEGSSVYSVPGVIDLPEGKKGGGGASALGSANGGSGTNKKSRGNKRLNNGAGGATGSEEVDGRLPNKKKKKAGHGGSQKEFFEKTVINGEEELIFQMEVTKQTRFFECQICQEFVKWGDDQNEVYKCRQCSYRFCPECIEKNEFYGMSRCPNCRQEAIQRDGVAEINNLEWQCKECNQEDVTIPDMKAHVAACQIQVSCEYEGCDFSGTSDELEDHQLECKYRPVNIGRHEFPSYLSEFIENSACDVPDGEDVENWSPGVAVSLLLEKIKGEQLEGGGVAEAQQSAVGGSRQCQACEGIFSAADFVGHLSRCKRMSVDCEYCNDSVVRGELENHRMYSCENYKEVCRKCDLRVCVKDMNDHLALQCVGNLVVCEACLKSIAKKDMQSHSDICKREMFLGGERGERISGAEFPVYRGLRNCEEWVMVFIPVNMLRGNKEFYVGDTDRDLPTGSSILSIQCEQRRGESRLTIKTKSPGWGERFFRKSVQCLSLSQEVLFEFVVKGENKPVYVTVGDLPVPESGWVIFVIR